jgi:Flp pilus assembly pilin Flp
MQPRQWLSRRLEAMRTSASRGATLVEYALVFSLLIVVCMGAIDALTASASKEISNQATCVETRPPPPECEGSAIPDEVTYPNPNVFPPAPDPSELPEEIFLVTTGTPDVEGTPSQWAVELPVSVVWTLPVDPQPAPEPQAGVLVRAEVRITQPQSPQPFFAECVTDELGECIIRFDVPYSDATRLRIQLINVESNPPPEELPPLMVVNGPT